LIALVVMAAVTVFALEQRSEAQDRRAEARTQAKVARTQAHKARVRELVARATVELTKSPTTSLALATRAARSETNDEVEAALRRALLADRQRAVITASGPVGSAAFSLDGLLVAAGDENGMVRVARRSGDIVRTIDAGAPVRGVVFLRRRLLVVAAGRVVRTWRSDGTPGRTLRHSRRVVALAATPDGVVATGTSDGRVLVWRGRSGPLEMNLRLESAVRQVAVTRDGSKVVAVGTSFDAAVFDATTGEILFRPDRAGGVRTAAWTVSGRRLATGSPGGAVRVWRTGTGDLWTTFDPETKGHVLDVAFSPSGKYLVSASTDGTARLWNVPHKLPGPILAAHTNHVVSATFSPDERLVATASDDRTARIWRRDSGNRLTQFIGHEDDVRGAEFSADGHRVLTWSDDGTARVWDPETQPTARVIGRTAQDGERAAIAPDTGIVAVVTQRGAVRVSAPGRRPRVLRQPGGTGAVALARDGTIVATGGRGGTAMVYGPAAGPPRRLRHGSPISALALDESGTTLVTAGRDGSSRLWRLNGRASELQRVRGPVEAAAISPDARFVALGSRNGRGFVLDAASGRVVSRLVGHRKAITGLAFSPDGRRLASASVDRDGRLWDVPSGRPGPTLLGHFARVNGIAYSSDGRWIVTAGPSTAGIWTAPSGEFQGFVRVDRKEVLAAGFTTRGWVIRTVGIDGTIRQQRCTLCARESELRALADARLRRAARQERPPRDD
jgi:WD40 repeat protein